MARPCRAHPRSLTHTSDRSDRRSRDPRPGARARAARSDRSPIRYLGGSPMASTHEILGRQEVDDLEAILAVTNTDVDEVEHLVQSNGDAIFTWDYDRSRPALGRLYERAKKSQWNAQLPLLLDEIIEDPRWDMTYLGMQIMVEGLALAAFGFIAQMTTEPLLKQLLRYVMSDEARHVAFGVLSLQEYYQELSGPEIRERQEFAFEAAVRMRDRFLQQEVFEHFGVNVKDAVHLVMQAPDRKMFQSMLFSKIVPNCKKLGLLDAGDGWLRERFTELGVIQFEDWTDTGEEYATLDEVSKDREEASA